MDDTVCSCFPVAIMRSQTRSALQRALAIQHKASLKGFDWVDPADALEKVREETGEVASHLASRGGSGGGSGGESGGRSEGRSAELGEELGEELGDLVFAVVNVARLAGVDPERALARATAKFEVRFAEVERIARQRNLPMPGTPLEVLDGIWDEVKAGPQ